MGISHYVIVHKPESKSHKEQQPYRFSSMDFISQRLITSHLEIGINQLENSRMVCTTPEQVPAVYCEYKPQLLLPNLLVTEFYNFDP